MQHFIISSTGLNKRMMIGECLVCYSYVKPAIKLLDCLQQRVRETFIAIKPGSLDYLLCGVMRIIIQDVCMHVQGP